MIGWLLASSFAIPPPPELEGVGVDEQVGAVLPDLPSVGAWGDDPVVLQLVWYRCEALCGPTSDGLAAAVAAAGGTDGFRVVTLGLDPRDDAADAAAWRERTLGPTEADWTFATGGPVEIATLADALGLRFRWVPEVGWVHPAVAVIVTPGGRVARYLYGIRPDPGELREAVDAARAGRVGGPPQPSFVSRCLQWTAATTRNGGKVVAFLRIGGVAVLGGVACGLLWLWARRW